MRPSNKQRSRNKSGSNQPRRNNMGNIVNRVFESAGPDGKVRGTPQQIIDKYQVLARDAQVSGDRVAAENYLQHAEHYARLLSEAQRQNQENRPQERDDRDDRDEREDDRQYGERQYADRPGGERQYGDRQGGERQGERQHDRQAGDRPNGQHAPQERRREPADEPAGLATFGGDDAGEAGPVETPEAAAWDQPEPAERRRGTQPAPVNGEPAARASGHNEATQDAPAEDAPARGAPEAAAAEPAEAPAPKRTRSRRKTKPAAEVIEASAD